MSKSLATISKAKRALAAAKSLDEVLEVRDQAEAARVYAKAACDGLELQNSAAEIKIRAERKAGEMLVAMEKIGHRPKKGNTALPFREQLSDLGITKMQSSRWQRIASVEDNLFESHLADFISSKRELTTVSVYKLATKNNASTVADPEEYGTECTPSLDNLTEKFGTVYADPPWRYGNQSTRAATDNHYPTMTVDELCEMPVSEHVADDAHIHLWTTNAFLFDSRRVLESWGFEYRSCFVWCKPQMGIGNYWRVSHEFLILGIRGNAKRFNQRNQKSWQVFERRKHSEKPDELRKIIKDVSPGPYLEMFGRKPVDGWTVLGNQITDVDSERRLFAS